MPAAPQSKDKNQQEISPQITSKNSGEIESKTKPAANNEDLHNEDLRIVSVTGSGVEHDKNSIKINRDLKDLFAEGWQADKDMQDTFADGWHDDNDLKNISREQQEKVANEITKDKNKKSKDDQTPAPNPNASNPQESAPLVPSETPPAPGPGGGQQTAGVSPNKQPPAGEPSSEEEQSPGDGAGAGQDQNEIAAQMDQDRQMDRQKINTPRTQLVSQRKKLDTEIENLEELAGNLSSTPGSTFLDFLMPSLAGKIKDAVALAKLTGGDNYLKLQLASLTLAAVLDVLIMARILAGIIDGIVKWGNFISATAALYWWTVVGAVFDIIIVLPLFMIIFLVIGGELCLAVNKLRNQIKKLKEEIDYLVGIQKQIRLKKQKKKQIDAAIGPMSQNE